MPLFLLNMFKSKGTYIALIAVGAIAYHYWTVNSLENTISKQGIKIEQQKVKIAEVQLNFHTCTVNYNETVEVNRNNDNIIKNCVGHTEELSRDYSDIVQIKNRVINDLRKEISDMNEPVIYPEEVVFEECIVKIKGAEDAETNSTFDSLNNIGY